MKKQSIRLGIYAIFMTVMLTTLVACGGEVEPSITVPAGAQAGDLTMEPCTLTYGEDSYGAECGTLVVPENRSDPDSRLIALPVQRFTAPGGTSSEPVFFLWGGPGASNIQSQPPPDWLLDNYDLVAVGYRGVDGSVVLDMPEISEAFKGAGGDLFSDESLNAVGEAMASGAARLQQEGVDLSGYTIPEVVADMEAARTALGYDRINLYSHSYGTRVAQIYSWLHPESLHRTLLLSANPPGRMVREPDMVDAQIAYYSELCAQDPECSQRTPDLAATVRNVFDNMPTRWGLIPIDPGKVRIVTFQLLSNIYTANLILDTLIAAEQGDPAGLALMSMGYTVEFDFPHAAVWGNTFAIAHSADFDPTQDYRTMLNRPDTIIGEPFSQLLWSGADKWPYTPIPAELRQSQPSDVETLVVAGSVDVLTPKEYSIDELMPHLNKGQLVSLSEAGHDGFTVQEDAYARLVTSFYDTGVGDDSLYEYQPMDFSVEVPFTDSARNLVRQFVVYPALGLLFIVALITGIIIVLRRRRRSATT